MDENGRLRSCFAPFEHSNTDGHGAYQTQGVHLGPGVDTRNQRGGHQQVSNPPMTRPYPGHDDSVRQAESFWGLSEYDIPYVPGPGVYILSIYI